MIVSNLNPYAETINGKVELYTGSTLSQTCTCEDVLQDFTVERIGENNKFFGYGICQKISINLIDIERALSVSTSNNFKVYYGVENTFIKPYPTFYVSEVNRDENTNSISVTAYDRLYKVSAHAFNELPLAESYTINDVAQAVATFIGAAGLSILGVGAAETCFSTLYENGANFSGTENLREVLNAIAEATQTIYYIDSQEQLVFKRLDVSGEAVETITRDYYFLLDSKTNRRLSAVCHATELGDNVTASLDSTGTTQYVRNNPFWDLREDIAELVENALAVVGGLTLNQFSMYWTGNFLLEVGDKIAFTLENGSTATSYLLNDVVNYIGCIEENTEFNFEDNESETASNPSTLGEALKQTYARVDKANQRIELVAGVSTENTTNISKLLITTGNITSSVEEVEKLVNDNNKAVNNEIATLTKRVETTVTPEAMTIAIQEEMAKGTDKVTTSTGFTFNNEGLTVSKTESEMETKITEDGMTVSRGTEDVLIADNTGVKAENLHATTYLIIDTTSRFEDWNGRTACFWIGG